jgi:flagellar basal-body rod protein FlgB
LTMGDSFATRKLFDRTMGFLQRSLDVRTTRHKILSGNVANAETPGYRPMDIPFQRVLEQTLHSDSSLQLRKTHRFHIPATLERPVEMVPSAEGVNLDQEMASLAENNLMFQAGVQALMKKLEALKTTILDGGK